MKLFSWTFGLLLVSGNVEAQAPTSDAVVDVRFAVQVCEGAKFEPLLNDKIGSREADCTKPVPGVPLALATAFAKTPFVQTDTTGRAVVGPFTVRRDEEFRVAMACTTHKCMNLNGLKVNKGTVVAGENVLLVFTVPNQAPAPVGE